MGRRGTECSLGCRPNGQSLICNCVVLGGRRLHEPIERSRQAKLRNRCRQSLSGLSSSQGECTQVVLGDSPWRGFQWQTSFNGEVRESSDQQGQGPGGTSQRPYVQLSPECDTLASASLPLIGKGRAGRESVAKCWRDCGTGPLCQVMVGLRVWYQLLSRCDAILFPLNISCSCKYSSLLYRIVLHVQKKNGSFSLFHSATQ